MNVMDVDRATAERTGERAREKYGLMFPLPLPHQAEC